MHKDWIDVGHFSWSETKPTVTNPPIAGPLTLEKPADRATPRILQYCATGVHIPTATLHFSQVLDQELILYQVRLVDVAITRAETTSDVASIPFDSFSMSYARVEWTVSQYDIKGQKVADHVAYWDLNTGATGSTPLPAILTIQGSTKQGWVVSWLGEEGRSYVLQASSRVDAGYQPVAEAVGVKNEVIQRSFPDLRGPQFFKLQTVR